MSIAMAPAPAIDSKVLRSALGTFPTGVAVVTARAPDGTPVGITCNSFNSVSLDPPLVSWGLRLSSSNLETFRIAPAFTVNILAEHQADLSAQFARRDIADKFAGVAWREGLGGAAVLEGCVTSFQCEKFAEHVAGDHVLFLGRVVHFDHGSSDAMVFYRGAYMMVAQSLRQLAARCSIDAVDLQNSRRLFNCMLVRQACERATEEDFRAIEANIDALEAAALSGDVAARIDVGLEFFRLVARAAHSEVLMAVAESLATILHQVLDSVGPALRFRTELVPARRRILACMRARDVAGAEQEMSDYFRETRHLERSSSASSRSFT